MDQKSNGGALKNHHIDPARDKVHRFGHPRGRLLFEHLHIFRPDRQRNGFVRGSAVLHHLDFPPAGIHDAVGPAPIEEIGCSHKVRDKAARRVLIDVNGPSHLPELSAFHHHNPIGN